jgi:hypothetical protein
MKVWADLSAIAKIAFVCVVIGFLLGLCASGVVHGRPSTAQPPVTPTAMNMRPALADHQHR